jgi:hypothetical protein
VSHPGKAAAGRKKDGSWHKEGTDVAGRAGRFSMRELRGVKVRD